MATYGIPGTATYSVTFNSLDAMMAAVPDNNRQAIGATAVRNSLFTLWEISGGLTGGAGTQGPQGPGIGTQGPQGLIGFQGVQGNVGLQGFQGRQGFQGFQGFQGQGVQGNQGVAGPGYTGSVGVQGNIGPTGIGTQGPQGLGATGFQGYQGVIGFQGISGDVGATGTGQIIGYSILIQMSGGYPQSILGASSSTGVILHNGTSWISGWSNDPIGNSSNNYLFTIYHPLSTKLLNMTTHGLNLTNLYSIAVYGKSPAGTQYCTLVQASNFTSFSVYGISYMSTSCAQSGSTTVTITFQVQT